MTRTLLAVAFTVAALSACAPQPSPVADAPGVRPTHAEGRQCFRAQDVNGYSTVSADKVNLRVGVNDVYQLELMGACPDIDWSLRLGIESRGSSWICSGLDATIITPGPIGAQRCPVRSVRKLSDAEVAALPTGQKP